MRFGQNLQNGQNWKYGRGATDGIECRPNQTLVGLVRRTRRLLDRIEAGRRFYTDGRNPREWAGQDSNL